MGAVDYIITLDTGTKAGEDCAADDIIKLQVCGSVCSSWKDLDPTVLSLSEGSSTTVTLSMNDYNPLESICFKTTSGTWCPSYARVVTEDSSIFVREAATGFHTVGTTRQC